MGNTLRVVALSTLSILIFTVFLPQGYMAIIGQIVTPSTGVIAAAGLGLYKDSACTQPFTQIDWGTVFPNSTIRVPGYLKNTGNFATYLTLGTRSWAPVIAGSYLSLGWTYTGEPVSPNQMIPLQFILNISPTIDKSGISSFGFDVIIGNN